MLRMTDIAAKAGVSQSTVSFVLNGRDTSVRISENTRQKVLAAAEEMGYRSNHLARAMRTGNTQMLGFIGGDFRMEHVGRMLDGALEAAENRGFTLKILPHRESENGLDQIVRRASELRLMGVVALHLPVDLLELLREETRHCGSSMLLLDTPVPLDGVQQVATDDENGVFLAVQHLVNFGHRRIALIGSHPTVAKIREQAFFDAMKHFGLVVDEELVKEGDFQCREKNIVVARTLLTLPPVERPTAVFCVSDLIACVTLQVACELKLSVPGDLSVIGFGDLHMARFVVPRLTTVQQPFRQMGKRAIEQIIDQSEQKSTLPATNGHPDKPRDRDVDVGLNGRATSKRELLPVTLIERDSTGPVPLPKATRKRVVKPT